MTTESDKEWGKDHRPFWEPSPPADSVPDAQRSHNDQIDERLAGVEAQVLGVNAPSLSFYRPEPVRKVEPDYRTILAHRFGDTVYLQARLSTVMEHVPWWCFKSNITSPVANKGYVEFVEGEIYVRGVSQNIDVSNITFTGADWTPIQVDETTYFYLEIDIGANAYALKSCTSWPPTVGEGVFAWILATATWNGTRNVVESVKNHNVGTIQIWH